MREDKATCILMLMKRKIRVVGRALIETARAASDESFQQQPIFSQGSQAIPAKRIDDPTSPARLGIVEHNLVPVIKLSCLFTAASRCNLIARSLDLLCEKVDLDRCKSWGGSWVVIVILKICDEDEGSSLVQQRMDGLANPSETKCSANGKKVGISWMLRYYKTFLLLAFYSSDFAV